MLSKMDKVRSSQAFQISHGKRVSVKNSMHVNSEQFDVYNVDMKPTRRMISECQMTPKHIQRTKSKAIDMVAEITKTYARKGKPPTTPVTKKETPLMAAPIQ
jgi:hypothetical protein